MTWHKIFDSEEAAKQKIPLTKTRLLVVEGQRICLAHTQQGLFAIDDLCPHLGESLSKGTTNYLNEVVCPWHSYRYQLNSGAECQYRTRNARIYPIEIREDGVYLGL